MRKITLPALCLCWIALTCSRAPWGFFAHKEINRLAVFTLPPEMVGYFKQNVSYLSEHAVDPDKRRYISANEAPRHYIDLDRYIQPGEDLHTVLPASWDSAVARYGEDTLLAHGIVPWQINRSLQQLTHAFRSRNAALILRHAADLGHYVGDAHVPLHTTANYNGQLSGQKGIHGFWESRLPELYFDQYTFWTGRAVYLHDPLTTAWNIVQESFGMKDTVLSFEAILHKNFPSDKKYAFEQRGKILVRTYSEAYSAAYHTMLNGMVERRMRAAVYMTGCYWYTAWVNAGQPGLDNLEALLPVPEKDRDTLQPPAGALPGHADD